MRIRRLRLRHFRGIEERELRFEPKGVHLIEGPNEAGKSSLVEALRILLDELDSTTKQEVRAVRPVDRDVGTEVEAELESGPYRFLYRKRFFRERETVLRVDAPRPESLTGREAHARALEILDQSMDPVLFRALRIQQGEGLEQASLAAAPSLARALDRAAGQEATGEREQTLFESVEEEYRRYFTAQGQEGKELRHAAEELDAAREALRRAEEEHERLRRDVERLGLLEREIADRTREAEDAEALAVRREREAEAIRRREEGLSRLAVEERAQSVAEKAARQARDARAELVRKAEEASRRRAGLEADAARNEPLLAAAEARSAGARKALAEAERAAREAQATFQLRHADLEMVEGALKVAHLSSRLERAASARRERAAAAETLVRIRVTDDWLRRASEAEKALARLEARLDAESPRLRIEAERGLAIELDGKRMEVPAGVPFERAVTESLEIPVPERFRLTLRTGRGGEELRSTVDRARASLEAMLRDAGVPDLAAAVAALRARQDAEQAVRECDRRIAENLEDLSHEELEQRLDRTREWVERQRRARAAEPPVPGGYDEAKALRDEAKRRAAESESGLEGLRAAAEEAERAARTLRDAVQGARIEVKLAQAQERAARESLAEARAGAADEAVEAHFREAEARAREARQATAAERKSLEELEPERIRAIALNARNAAGGAQQRLRESRDESLTLQGRLQESGGRPLFDAREEAAARAAALEAERAALLARAAAASLLYTTMRECREAARRAYRAPLRERIVTLGRFVFGEAFSVELDEELAIATRTLGGRTVPFGSLSAGAREQLALLSRVACALLVDPGEGAPLILDDALGHSDPERLEGLGAVLAEAGRHCQVIVLTCTPGRFRHVGGAMRMRL